MFIPYFKVLDRGSQTFITAVSCSIMMSDYDISCGHIFAFVFGVKYSSYMNG